MVKKTTKKKQYKTKKVNKKHTKKVNKKVNKKHTKKVNKKQTKKQTKKLNRKVNKSHKLDKKKVKKHTKKNMKRPKNEFKMMSYQSNYSNIDGDINTMERKVISDNEKTDIWEKTNDDINTKTIIHNQIKEGDKVILEELQPLSSFNSPYLMDANPFYDFVYSPNVFSV